MDRTTYTIRDKVLKVIVKVNDNSNSKHFKKKAAIIECDNHKIYFQQIPEASPQTTDLIINHPDKIAGRSCIFTIKEIGE